MTIKTPSRKSPVKPRQSRHRSTSAPPASLPEIKTKVLLARSRRVHLERLKRSRGLWSKSETVADLTAKVEKAKAIFAGLPDVLADHCAGFHEPHELEREIDAAVRVMLEAMSKNESEPLNAVRTWIQKH